MKALATRTLTALLTGLMATALHATVIFTGSSGSLAASASFTVSGSTLTVVLTNTSSADVLVPSDVLTAVFFSAAGNPALTRTSGLLTAGSVVFYDADGQPAGGVIGGEWAYVHSAAVWNPYGANSGISSTGLGLFGPGDRFPGADLESPASPDGVQYGLLSAGDNTGTGNTGVTGSGGLIKNSATFVLSGLPAGFSETDIGNITFQYGTSLTETHISTCTDCPPPPHFTPEPQSLALLGLGLVALAFARRRRSA